MTDRDLMQQALEALETNNQAWKQLADSGDAGFWEAEEQPFYELSVKAITALRQALETEQKPFEYWSVAGGWVKLDEMREHFEIAGCGTIYKSAGEGRTPLYTAPPKQWVGLTEQEPVAWLSTDCIGERYLCFTKPKDNDPVQPLYTAPPKREWVGLTDEDMEALFLNEDGVRFARYIEAKLKERNE